MHRQMSTVIAILALLLTGALVGGGPASASIPDSPVTATRRWTARTAAEAFCHRIPATTRAALV